VGDRVTLGMWVFLAFLIYALVLIALPVIAGVLSIRWARMHPYPAPGESSTIACRRCQQRYWSAEVSCPHCGQPRPAPSGGIDPQSWSRGKVMALGAVTIWPFFYMAVFFGVALSMIAFAFSGDYPFWVVGCVFPLHFITIFVSMALLVLYIILVVNSHEFDSSQRTMWIVALILAGWIPQLVGFVVFVWRPWIAAHPAPPGAHPAPSPPAPPRDPIPPVG
jgi:hypothetical protein